MADKTKAVAIQENYKKGRVSFTAATLQLKLAGYSFEEIRSLIHIKDEAPEYKQKSKQT